MSKKEPKNCWEFWNCPKDKMDKCPSYQIGSGRECWLVVGAERMKNSLKVKHKFKDCTECLWFQKLNPNFNKE